MGLLEVINQGYTCMNVILYKYLMSLNPVTKLLILQYLIFWQGNRSREIKRPWLSKEVAVVHLKLWFYDLKISNSPDTTDFFNTYYTVM